MSTWTAKLVDSDMYKNKSSYVNFRTVGINWDLQKLQRFALEEKRTSFFPVHLFSHYDNNIALISPQIEILN